MNDEIATKEVSQFSKNIGYLLFAASLAAPYLIVYFNGLGSELYPKIQQKMLSPLFVIALLLGLFAWRKGTQDHSIYRLIVGVFCLALSSYYGISSVSNFNEISKNADKVRSIVNGDLPVGGEVKANDGYVKKSSPKLLNER